MADRQCHHLPCRCWHLEELLQEIITWKQLGLYLNPIADTDVKNYFDPLLDMLGRQVDENFMRTQHGAIWHGADTAGSRGTDIYHSLVGTPPSVNSLQYDRAVDGLGA